MKKYILPFILLALLISCKSENDVGGNDALNGNGNVVGNELSITIGAEHISAVSAILKGKANLGSTVASDLSMGIMWSTNAGVLPSNSTKVEATNMDGDYNYSVGITVLEPETTYYYRSYFTQNGQDTYGETKSFTTKVLSSLLETLDASDVEAASATLNAKLDLTDVQYNSLVYGFLWGTSESALSTDYKCTEISDNAISAPLTGLSHKTQYWYKAYVKLDSQTFYGEVKTFTTVFAEKVDMGIKTSDGKTLYWSTRNLCESGFVNSPEDYGDYYAWGETEPYYSSQSPLAWKNGKSAGYNWASYKWCNGSSNTFTKYNTKSSYGSVDNKTVLEPEDDVAHVKLGGQWRMPTDAEWTELRTKCTWTWTTNYNGTGVSGRIFTAPNGNSIFLPAAGYRNDADLSIAGSYGLYWSSSLSADNPLYAWVVDFGSDDVSRFPNDRYYGQSVRPVWED